MSFVKSTKKYVNFSNRKLNDNNILSDFFNCILFWKVKRNKILHKDKIVSFSLWDSFIPLESRTLVRKFFASWGSFLENLSGILELPSKKKKFLFLRKLRVLQLNLKNLKKQKE